MLHADDDFFYDDDIILIPGKVNTKMAPYDENCDFGDQEGFPNVYDQCFCDQKITVIPDDVREMRSLILERVLPKFYEQNMTQIPAESCNPINMAAMWLAAGDNRDAGEARQRFALAMSFFSLNGTIWDYTDAWMSELNECLWMGVQCNNRNAMNSIALDTNNVFGMVRSLLIMFVS